MIAKLVILTIKLYQKTLSPDHGLFKARYPYGFCRFYPSCSEYTKLSIIHHGLVKGIYFGLKRILRCNPWSDPRVDSVHLHHNP